MKLAFYSLLAVWLTLPYVSFADETATSSGLVPCGNPGQPACETCHVYQLVENVFEWIFGIASIVLAIAIVVGGFRLVTAGGNQVAKSDARKWIGTALVGFTLIFSAWMLVEITIDVLMGNDNPSGIWTSLQCSESADDDGG